MRSDLEFTGERFVPGIAGEIAHEHWHRYAFARRFAAGRRVLDVACGEGYGSALLSEVAAEVTGVDIAHDVVDHARTRYADRPNVRFEQGSAAAIPLADGAVDVVVSFETIEHLPHAEQPRMLAEIARVLTRDGILILSVPNPVEYSQARNYRNPFHLHEPPREELLALLGVDFPAQRWYHQRRHFGSAIWSQEGKGDFEAWEGSEAQVQPARLPAAMYHVIVAARTAAALPSASPAVSIFADRDEAELARFDANAAEVLRLDGLLKERDATLTKTAEHVLHLEALVATRDRLVVERDAQLAAANAVREESEHARNVAQSERDRAVQERDAVAVARDEAARMRDEAAQSRDDANAALASARQAVTALTAESERLERAIAAQERIIAYRQSARWWLKLPWLRLALWWRGIRRA